MTVAYAAPATPQCRTAQPAKDQNGIQHDVDQCAGNLGDGGLHGSAGGLQQLFISQVHGHAQGANGADPQIAYCKLRCQGIPGLGVDIRRYAHQPEQQIYPEGAKGQEDGIAGNGACLLPVSCPQAFGQQCVDAHAGTHADRYHQHLHRERQCQGVYRQIPHISDLLRVRHAADKVAVHNVVQSLQGHGNDHRRPHAQQQPAYRNGTHFVLFC